MSTATSIASKGCEMKEVVKIALLLVLLAVVLWLGGPR